MRCDAMIKGWLTTAMEEEIQNSVKYAKTSAEIWNDLKERLLVLWDEMESILPTPRCTCDGCECGLGEKLTELKGKERTYEFLMGLDDQFSVIKTQILAMKPTPDLSAAYHLVAEDEQQRTIASSKGPVREVVAFQTSFQWRECERDGHDKSGCFKIIGYSEWWPGKGKWDKPKPKATMVDTKLMRGP
ncbi:hypothetical protein Tco_0286728 [Tanacetum coccineum]